MEEISFNSHSEYCELPTIIQTSYFLKCAFTILEKLEGALFFTIFHQWH